MKKSKLNIGFCLLYYLVGFMSIHAQPATNKKIDYKPKGVDLSKELDLRSQLQDENLLSLIVSEDNEYAPIDIFKGKVYYDKNPNSAVYYYLPGRFNLLYNKKKGKYKINLTYPEDETGERKVTFKALFGSSIDKNAKSLLERILFQITKQPRIKVRPLDLQSNPVIEFPFSQFDIPKESILITENSDYTVPMSVTWAVGQKKSEAFFAKMSNEVDFNGTISWDTQAMGIEPPQLKIHLSLLSPKSIGEFYYEKPTNLFSKGFHNNTFLPIKINSILVLNKKKSGMLIFHKEKLYGIIVKPQTKFKKFPLDIKRRVTKYANSQLLLEYEVLDCEECHADAARSLGNYKATKLTDWVQVWDVGACEFAEALAIQIKVDKIYQTVNIKKGEDKMEAFKAPKLLSGELNYRYTVTLIRSDKNLTSKLIKNEENQSSIILTKDFIKKHFRQFRNKN